MRVLLFGRYADVAGWRSRDVAGPASLSALIDILAAETPTLANDLRAGWTLVTRNLTQVRGDMALSPGDEVAFMPPMSGG
jgi:molybdopterin converting factor small subunit